MANSGNSETLFYWAPKSLQMVTAGMKLRHLLFRKKGYDEPSQHIKKQSLGFADKVPIVKAMVFPVVMYGCENWTIKKG